MLNNKETIKKVIILLIFAIAIIIRIIKWPLINNGRNKLR